MVVNMGTGPCHGLPSPTWLSVGGAITAKFSITVPPCSFTTDEKNHLTVADGTWHGGRVELYVWGFILNLVLELETGESQLLFPMPAASLCPTGSPGGFAMVTPRHACSQVSISEP